VCRSNGMCLNIWATGSQMRGRRRHRDTDRDLVDKVSTCCGAGRTDASGDAETDRGMNGKKVVWRSKHERLEER